MKEVLVRLLDLQSVDGRIAALAKERGVQPAVLAEARAHLRQHEAALGALKEQKKELQKNAHAREVELKSYEERILRHKMQLNVIKSNKEYAAISHEIKMEEADQSRVEEAALEILEKIDETEEQVAEVGKGIEGEKEKVEAMARKVDARIREIDDELGTLRQRRREMADAVDREALADYARVLARVGATAVTRVVNTVCMGCNMSVTSQTLNNIMASKRLVRCSNCQRILYLDNEQDTSA